VLREGSRTRERLAAAEAVAVPRTLGYARGPNNRTETGIMTVAKVIEISSRSTKSFEDAVQTGIDRVNDSVEQVSGAWIQDHKVVVKSGRIVEYQVIMKVTFVVAPSRSAAKKPAKKK
jgi:dodecin